MSAFTNPVEYIKHPDVKGLYIITKTFRFYYADSLHGDYVEIPADSITNFATIPKVLQWLWKPYSDEQRAPSAVHDGLVGEFGEPLWVMRDNQRVRQLNWEEAALWYRAALRARGCPGYRRQFFYRSVLAYGRVKTLFA